jgi:GT2 family glycosyltransferase
MDLSIIILNFNTKNLLINLLDSLKKADRGVYKIEIIVVDNASADGSQEMVEKHYPETKLIKNLNNIGYSKANNIAAIKAKGKYLLFLNSDTLVSKDTLVNVLDFVHQKKVKALTCRVELKNGKLDPASHRGFPTPWASFTYFFGFEKIFPQSKLFSQYHQGWKDLGKIHQVDAISGAFFFISKNTFFKANKFDEDYFMYGEDLDLCYKLKKLNIPVYFYPGTKIIHFKKRSGRKKDMSNLSKQKQALIRKHSKKHFYETMKTFYKKHYQHQYPWIVKQLVLLGIFIISKFKN